MKTTIYKIQNSIWAVNILTQLLLRPKDQFCLIDLKEEMMGRLKIYEEMRIKLCEKYGKHNDKTKKYDIAKEKQETFNKEVVELINCEVELKYTTMTKDQFNFMISVKDENAITEDPIMSLKGLVWKDNEVKKTTTKKKAKKK